MSDEHDHSHHDHSHDAAPQPADATPAPLAVEDAGTQALSDALRSSFVIVKFIMAVLVVVFFASGIFTVPSQEKAIVLRFGKPVGVGQEQLLAPGLHFAFPAPIDEVVRIPISQIQTVTSSAGWYATTPEAEATNTEPDAGPSLNPATEGYALTRDGNIIHVRATLRYRINNPLDYTLNFVNASNVVQNALNNALLHTAAKFTVDDALSTNRIAFQERVVARVRELIDREGLGITVEQSEVRSIPPRWINRDFKAVLDAEMERRATNEVAQSYASRVLSAAQGEAANALNAGETDRTRFVQAIGAEARYFTNQLPHFQRNPGLFMSRLQVDALRRILTNSEKSFTLSRELRVQLSREPLKVNGPTPP